MKAAKLTVVANFILDEAAPVSVVTFFAPVAWAFEPIRAVSVLLLLVPADVLPPDPVLEAVAGVEAVVRDRRLVSDVLRIAPLICAEASGDSWPVIPVRLFMTPKRLQRIEQ